MLRQQHNMVHLPRGEGTDSYLQLVDSIAKANKRIAKAFSRNLAEALVEESQHSNQCSNANICHPPCSSRFPTQPHGRIRPPCLIKVRRKLAFLDITNSQLLQCKCKRSNYSIANEGSLGSGTRQ